MLYVFLEIRQTIWLWPVGIITSAVYIWVFFTSKFYADMSLQGYYLLISFMGWYWWIKGSASSAKALDGEAGHGAQGTGQNKEEVRGRHGDKDQSEKFRAAEREMGRRPGWR